MNKNMTSRGLAEGAIMAAISAILIFAGSMPLVGVFLLIFSGIPITIATVRNGVFTGVLSTVLTTILVSIILGPLSAVINALEYLSIGLVMGYMLYHKKKGSKTLQTVIIAAIITSIISFGITVGVMGISADSLTEAIDQYQTEMMDMYQESGMFSNMLSDGVSEIQLTEMLQQSIQFMVQFLPAILIISRCVMAVAIYYLSIFILKRLRIKVPRIKGFQKWTLPSWTIWGLIVTWALWLGKDYIPMKWLNILILNMMLLFAALLFINGLAVTFYWFKVKQMSTFMKVIGVLFIIFFFSGFLVACSCVGLADLLFDFRKLRSDNRRMNVRKD